MRDALTKNVRAGRAKRSVLRERILVHGIKVPKFGRAAIIADDAKLAAELSCLVAKQGLYVPIVDGPRLQRPDAGAEIIRRPTAIARTRVKFV